MDISSINYKSPQFIKIVGVVLLSIIVVYLWYSMSYSLNKEIIEQKRTDLESINSELHRAEMSVVQVEELWAEISRLFTQYKLIEELLPGDRDVPDFIQKIQLAAKQADAIIMKIEQKSSTQMNYYISDPYNIRIQTTFHGLGKFLSLVANLPFTALVRTVKIESLKSSKYTIAVSLTILAHHMGSDQRITKIEELRSKTAKAPKKKVTPKRKGEKLPS